MESSAAVAVDTNRVEVDVRNATEDEVPTDQLDVVDGKHTLDARRLALQVRLLEPLAARARDADERAARLQAAVQAREAAAQACEDVASEQAHRAREAEAHARRDAVCAIAETARAVADGARAAREAVVIRSYFARQRIEALRAAAALRAASDGVDRIVQRVNALAAMERDMRAELADKSARVETLRKEVELQAARADAACADALTSKEELKEKLSIADAKLLTSQKRMHASDQSSSSLGAEWKVRALVAEEKLQLALSEKDALVREQALAGPVGSIFSPAPLAMTVEGEDLLSESRSRFTVTLPFHLDALDEHGMVAGDKNDDHGVIDDARNAKGRRNPEENKVISRTDSEPKRPKPDRRPPRGRHAAGRSGRARVATQAPVVSEAQLRPTTCSSFNSSSGDDTQVLQRGNNFVNNRDCVPVVSHSMRQEGNPLSEEPVQSGTRASPRLFERAIPNMSDGPPGLTPKSSVLAGKRKRTPVSESPSPINKRKAKRRVIEMTACSPSVESDLSSKPSPTGRVRHHRSQNSENEKAPGIPSLKGGTAVVGSEMPAPRTDGRPMRHRKPVSYNYDLPGRDLVSDIGTDTRRSSHGQGRIPQRTVAARPSPSRRNHNRQA